MKTINYTLHQGIATLTFDEEGSPVNTMCQQWQQDLTEAAAQVVRDKDAIHGIILASAKSTFFAGADLKSVMRLKPEDATTVYAEIEQMKKNFRAIETLGKPVVSCLNGAALGGGWEVALVGHHRIAVNNPKIQFGLPEVTLGLIPGGGGITKMTRQLGLMAAQPYILEAKLFNPEQAVVLGLVHELVDNAADLLPRALAWIASVQGNTDACQHPWDRKGFKIPGGTPSNPAIAQGLVVAPAMLKKTTRGLYPAPEAALCAMVEGAQVDFDTAMRIESRYLAGLMVNPVARNMVNTFFFNMNAIKSGQSRPRDVPRYKPAKVGILGAGMMGAGIAYALTLSGLSVHVVETDAAGEARAQANLDKLIAQGVDRGSISDAAAFHARLTVRAGYDALPPVDLAIEAAFESMEVKRTIFAALQAALPETTVLATNTSYLDVFALAAGITDPGRFLGLHFFAPAHVMKLLEIVRGAQTSQAALGVGFALAKRLGKIPVVSGVCDGFIGNRILARYRQTADVLMIEGSCPKGIDAAMRGFGMAMGPYEAQDMSGLDIAHANRKRQNLRSRSDIRYVPIADTLVEDLGRLGRKSGAGWYDYDAAGKAVESDAVTQVIYRAADAAGITRVRRSPEEIANRALLAMIMEATRVLEEGIAARPQDIDLVMVHGYGFPRWRGGLMHHADTITPQNLLAQLEARAAEDPLSWQVPNLLRKLVSQKQNFQSLNT